MRQTVVTVAKLDKDQQGVTVTVLAKEMGLDRATVQRRVSSAQKLATSSTRSRTAAEAKGGSIQDG